MPNMAWNLTKLTWNLTIVINTRLEITKALESDVGCRVWHSKERGLSIYLLIGSMSKICHLSNHRIKFQQFGFITNDRKGKWLEHFILPTWKFAWCLVQNICNKWAFSMITGSIVYLQSQGKVISEAIQQLPWWNTARAINYTGLERRIELQDSHLQSSLVQESQ